MTTPEARAFGRGLVRVELATVLSNPFSRPVGWILLLGALPASIAVCTWLPPMLWIVSAALAYLIALASITGAYLIVAPGVEARGFDNAPHHWLRQYTDGQAGALARPDRKGRLALYSVWSQPRGHGVGSLLMNEVLHDTQPDGDLWLVAVNKRAAAFYLRHGFQHVRRDLLGHRMVLRRPRSGAERLSEAAVDVEEAAPGDRVSDRPVGSQQTGSESPPWTVESTAASRRHRRPTA